MGDWPLSSQMWKLELRCQLPTNGLSGVSVHTSDFWSSGQLLPSIKMGNVGTPNFIDLGVCDMVPGRSPDLPLPKKGANL